MGTSQPGPAELEPRYDQVTPAPLLTAGLSLQCFGLMETELIPNDRKVAFLEGLCPSSLSCFLVPCPITAACSTPHMLDVLLQNVCFQTCVNMWPYGLSPTCSECEKGLGHPVVYPQGHPGRSYWEAAETSALLTLLPSQQERQHPLLAQGWKPLDLHT